MESDSEAAFMAVQILVLVFLTMVNAFFAGAEMAMVSVNKNKIKRLAESGNKRAELIQKLSEDSTGFLSTIQVAITFAGFFSSASAATGISQVLADKMAAAGLPYSEGMAVAGVTIILSYFTLVFGELVPKRVALQRAELFSLFSVRPIYVVSKLLAPFIKLLSLSTNGFLRLIGMKTDNLEEEVSEEEIRAMLETGRESGVFNQIEQKMITSIFLFDDKKAKEVMVPRQEMVAVDISEPFDTCLDELLNSRHSRIPVFEHEIDNIIGVLSMKKLMIQAKNGLFENTDIRSLMQPAYFIPENRRIDELFQEMQKNKIRMAILIDEYGGVSGLVTMEDLIEEIVGDIHDEYEEVTPELLQTGPGIYQVSGSILLYDLNEELHTKIKSSCDTLSGYLIEQLHYIPKETDAPIQLVVDEIFYTIVTIEDRVIKTVKLELDKPEDV